MNKPGVTLIELVLGIALSSIIITLLYNLFLVTTRGIDIAEPFLENDLRSALIYRQLQKELDGVFIPFQAEALQTDSAQKKGEGPKPQSAEKPIDKVFYSINKDNSLAVLSFITNNPIRTYYDPSKGTPKPAIVRVVYRLKPTEKNGFALIRQESPLLAFDDFAPEGPKQIRGYELANNIKNISMEYTFPVPEKKENAVRYEKRNEWRFEEWKQKEQEKAPPKTPKYATMTLTLWDQEHRQESIIVFNFEIPTFGTAGPPANQPAPAAKPPAKSDEKTATPTPAEGQKQGVDNQKPTQPSPGGSTTGAGGLTQVNNNQRKQPPIPGPSNGTILGDNRKDELWEKLKKYMNNSDGKKS